MNLLAASILYMHKILDFKCAQSLKRLRDCILSSCIEGLEYHPSFNLSELHNRFDSKNINSIRLKAFHKLNQLNWESLLSLGCLEDLFPLLGQDLLIQKKLNLSIQMPDDSTSVLPAHSDCSSGDSPFELVIWIPLTDAYSTNSMFLLDEGRSTIFYDSMRQGATSPLLSPTAKDFLELKYGQYLIFPPSLIHGNVVNLTDTTRVSLNVRVKSVFSPYLPKPVPDRMYGAYYKEWHISKLFRWNMGVMKSFT